MASPAMRGLLVGRFQPFHNGHLAAVRAIRAARPDEVLLLAVGSAEDSYTPLNPFTAGERLEMIERTLETEQVVGVRAYPIPDIHRHALWVAHVVSLLPRFDRVYANNPLTRVLFEQAHVPVEVPSLVERERYSGVAIRERVVRGDSIVDAVPRAVYDFLQQIDGLERIRLLSATGPSITPEHLR